MELNELRERAELPNALHGCTSDPCGSVVCQTARDRDALLSRLEQAEQAVQRVRAEVEEARKVGEEILERGIDNSGYTLRDQGRADGYLQVVHYVTRALDGEARRCIECNGTGDVQVRFNHGIQTQDCAVCFGTGDGRG